LPKNVPITEKQLKGTGIRQSPIVQRPEKLLAIWANWFGNQGKKRKVGNLCCLNVMAGTPELAKFARRP